jgi:hypothetical protein
MVLSNFTLLIFTKFKPHLLDLYYLDNEDGTKKAASKGLSLSTKQAIMSEMLNFALGSIK